MVDLEGGGQEYIQEDDVQIIRKDDLKGRGGKNIQDKFESIKTNTLVLLLDPIFRALLCGLSPFCCKRSTDQKRALEKVEEKFVNELDAKIMLSKIRDSHDMISNLITKDYQEFLKYN
jgi:hypothetical protein